MRQGWRDGLTPAGGTLRISRILGLASCVVWLLPGIASARPPSADDSGADGWRFSFREDARQVFSTRTLVILGVGGALTAGAHAVEDPERQARAFDRFADLPDFGNTYGSATVMIGGTASLTLWGWTTGRPTFIAAGVDLARSFGYSTAVVGVMKVAFDRTRPDGQRHSFPSGHSSAAFSAAPVIAHHFGMAAGAAAYACAAVTLMGRMEDRKHYLSDVVFGAAVGLTMGEAIVAQRREAARHVILEPGRVGLRMGF